MLAVAGSGTAQAMTLGALLPAGVSALALDRAPGCGTLVRPAVGAIAAVPAVDALSKSAAILGGQSSRLAMIASQQEGQGAQAGLTASAPRPATLRIGYAANTDPATGVDDCTGFVRPGFEQGTLSGGPGRAVVRSDDFLASKRVAIARSPFDPAWARIRNERIDPKLANALGRMSGGQASFAMLTAVNSWANARVRYVEDDQLYGRGDYWASARQTLRKRAGDCEDIAIVKMQLLAAMGVDRSDMFLTIVRDLARNADHAVLIVRLGERNWLLDNSTSEVLDASYSHDYRPILSYSDNRKWIHGY